MPTVFGKPPALPPFFLSVDIYIVLSFLSWLRVHLLLLFHLVTSFPIFSLVASSLYFLVPLFFCLVWIYIFGHSCPGSIFV